MSNTKYYAEYVLTGNTRGGLLVEDTIYINKALSGVGINTIYTGGNALAVVGNANVTGRVTAGSKSFLIDHPLKKKWKLMYGSLEGPEYAVYIRGTIQASGKTAVITGSTRGIGNGIALGFAREGANVVISGTNAAYGTARTVSNSIDSDGKWGTSWAYGDDFK